MKKAQGLSIDTIVIAAIAVLILVILAYLVVSKLGLFGIELANCEKKGGECADCTDESCVCPEGTIQTSTLTCKADEGEKAICCVPVGQ